MFLWLFILFFSEYLMFCQMELFESMFWFSQPLVSHALWNQIIIFDGLCVFNCCEEVIYIWCALSVCIGMCIWLILCEKNVRTYDMYMVCFISLHWSVHLIDIERKVFMKYGKWMIEENDTQTEWKVMFYNAYGMCNSV